MRLTHSEPRSGTRWTDSGKFRERRELKHQAAGETRLVPVHPELVTLLRDHLERFGTGRAGGYSQGTRGREAAPGRVQPHTLTLRHDHP
jgi:integrase